MDIYIPTYALYAIGLLVVIYIALFVATVWLVLTNDNLRRENQVLQKTIDKLQAHIKKVQSAIKASNNGGKPVDLAHLEITRDRMRVPEVLQSRLRIPLRVEKKEEQ